MSDLTLVTVHELAPKKAGPLEKITVEGVDSEQIWAQLQLMAEPLGAFLGKSVSKALTANVEFPEGEESEEVKEDDDDVEEEDDYYDEEDEEGEIDDNDNEEENEESGGGGGKKTDVDFFDMDQMERFVQEAEREAQKGGDAANEEGDDEEEDLGLFEADEANDEAGEYGYEEFFGGPGDGDDDEEEEGENEFDFVEQGQDADNDGDPELLSVFEKRAKEVANQIRTIEQQLVEEKHWALRGEVTKKDRPESSLLESYVDFDQVTQGVPLLTEEHTARVEETIRKRVLEGTFDDVFKRRDTEGAARRSKPKVQLEFQKSEKGLGQVFEEAYLKATAEPGEDEQVPPEHREAQRLFRELCRSLDALTNDHYRPSAPAVKEISVKSKDVAAIALEEVAPVGVSGARLLAPEELGGRSKNVEAKSEKELEHDDRKRHRKQRKEGAKKKKTIQEQEKKARAAVDPVFAAKLKAAKEVEAIGKVKGTKMAGSQGIGGGTKAGKEYTKSATFFKNLQETVDGSGQETGSKKRQRKEGKSAASYKL